MTSRLGRLQGKLEGVRADADLLAALVLGADVGYGGGVIADEDEGQAGRDALALQPFDLLAQLLAYPLGDRESVDYPCRHGGLLSTPVS